MANRIIKVYSDTHMALGHRGLREKMSNKAIAPGEMHVFINRAKTAAKVLCANDVLFYLRPKSGKLDMHAIIELPKAIGIDSRLSYNKALELALVGRVNGKTKGSHTVAKAA